MEISDCTTPPVDFSLLCEVFELITENHVDRPLDPAGLAAGAALGIGAHTGSGAGSGPVPATMRCAIPDPAFVEICDVVESGIESGTLSVPAAIEDAVSTMIEFSLDPFTYYIPPELAGELSPDGIVSSVGLLVTIIDPVGSVCRFIDGACQLEVTFASTAGPAAVAGVQAGDIITAVNGQPVDGLSLIDIVGQLSGPEGSVVALNVERDETSLPLEIERTAVNPPTVDIELTESGVGYIKIPDFEADIPGLVHDGLTELLEGGATSIVVDLRDNPGGFVTSAIYVASEFLPDGVVMLTEGDEDLTYPILEGGLATEGPRLTVLVNGGSASASEVVAGALQERGRARIVGEPTFGKNTVQIGFSLRNDGELRVTIARWTTPEGTSVANTGLTPDDMVEIPEDLSTEELIELVGG